MATKLPSPFCPSPLNSCTGSLAEIVDQAFFRSCQHNTKPRSSLSPATEPPLPKTLFAKKRLEGQKKRRDKEE